MTISIGHSPSTKRIQARSGRREAVTCAGNAWLAVAACAALLIGAAARGAEPAAMDAGAVAKVFSEFDRPDQPGCSVGVTRNGALLHTSAHGMSNLATRVPLEAGSVFNIASTSKQFTAFSILLLDERKALSIDDPLIKYVPELAASARGVTLRHLLYHTGGLRDYTLLLMLRGRRFSDGATQFETIQTLGRQRAANTPPGTAHAYSNSGYVLLATVVERVSQRSMKQFADENIFQPLGMRHTTIIDRYPAILPKLARGYTPNKSKSGFDIEESAWEQVGDGQVHTTTADMLLWAENLNTSRIGGQRLAQRMVKPGALDSGEQFDYAAGLTLGEYKGLHTVGHGGRWAGYVSDFLMFPQQHLAVSVFCNRDDADPRKLSRAVAEVYLADEMHRTDKKSPRVERRERPALPPARWQPAQLSDYEGVYSNDEADARCVLVQRAHQLFLEGCMPGYKLQPADEQEFYAADFDGRLRFQVESSKPSGFTLQADGLNALVFKRL